MCQQNRVHFCFFQDINALEHEYEGMIALLSADTSIGPADNLAYQLAAKIETDQ